MDLESLLFAEVIGMIGIAGFLTLSLRRGKEPGSTDVARTLTPISTTVLRPGWKCNAEVIIGVREDGADVRLGIISCDEGCVTPVIRA